MELRLPGSGTLGEFVKGAIIDHITDVGDNISQTRDTDRKFHGATPEDVVHAVDLLAERSVEYIGLVDVEAEIQAIDVPGGFSIERSLGEEFVAYPATLSHEELRAAFLAFHAGDVDCGLTWPEPPPKPERTKRGWFRRG